MAETIRGNEAPDPGTATKLRLDVEDAAWLEEEAQRRRVKKEDLVKQAVNDMVSRESTGSAAYVNPEDFVAKAVHDFVARYKGERRADR
jgi:predicted transcriptional regulator